MADTDSDSTTNPTPYSELHKLAKSIARAFDGKPPAPIRQKAPDYDPLPSSIHPCHVQCAVCVAIGTEQLRFQREDPATYRAVLLCQQHAGALCILIDTLRRRNEVFDEAEPALNPDTSTPPPEPLPHREDHHLDMFRHGMDRIADLLDRNLTLQRDHAVKNLDALRAIRLLVREQGERHRAAIAAQTAAVNSRILDLHRALATAGEDKQQPRPAGAQSNDAKKMQWNYPFNFVPASGSGGSCGAEGNRKDLVPIRIPPEAQPYLTTFAGIIDFRTDYSLAECDAYMDALATPPGPIDSRNAHDVINPLYAKKIVAATVVLAERDLPQEGSLRCQVDHVTAGHVVLFQAEAERGADPEIIAHILSPLRAHQIFMALEPTLNRITFVLDSDTQQRHVAGGDDDNNNTTGAAAAPPEPYMAKEAEAAYQKARQEALMREIDEIAKQPFPPLPDDDDDDDDNDDKDNPSRPADIDIYFDKDMGIYRLGRKPEFRDESKFVEKE